MNCFAGIDIGSTSIKIVLIDGEENILGQAIAPTGSNFHRNTHEVFERLLAEQGLHRQAVRYAVSTGYGRKLYKEADETISEITANAAGARKSGSEQGRVRTIINIGGQDLKVIRLDDEGHVGNFAMNDKCAAGTGRFLEMTARNLEVEVEKLGDLHLAAEGMPVTVNSTCTVFAESEIISLLANGHPREELAAGIHYSIARRVARLAKRMGIEDVVFFDGGPALNPGLARAIEDELMRPLVIPQNPQVTTAYGAALLACEAYIFSEAVNE